MKVLSAALVSLTLLFGGLTAASPANADPYPHSVPTVCVAKPKPRSGRIHAGRRPPMRFLVQAGGAHPTAKFVVKAKSAKKLQWKLPRTYHGHAEVFLLRKLPVGKYTIRVKTRFAADSVYKNCKTKYSLKVVR
ncbi:MAG: hypothetical protein QM714_10705 [Nocardioides sp.]|uniref:hypothetical protein n=1 Tax=Nocardioides sp. TaxID=35761 RepID=UPI0039E26217